MQNFSVPIASVEKLLEFRNDAGMIGERVGNMNESER